MKSKNIIKRLTAFLIAFVLVAASGAFDAIPVFAAGESSVMGTNNYTSGAVGGATLTTGSTYSFGGYSWVVAEQGTGYAVLQSTGVTSGTWPGYAMAKFGTANSYYTSNIDGQDISGYNTTMTNLYNAIKGAEKTSVSFGSGLFLVGTDKTGTESYSSVIGTKKIYRDALKTAATNYSSFGASYYCAWLGTVSDGSSAWYVGQSGNVNGNYNQANSYVVAPAFNLDTSKVTLSGTTLTLATFSNSTGISATQSTTTLTAGQTKALSQVISGATYVGGTNAGKSASYKITTNYGTISGTNWTIPSSNTAKTATLTITETGSGKNFSTTKTVTINPDISSLSVVQGTTSVAEGSTIALSTLFTSVKYNNNTNASYSVSVKTSNGGSISGSNYVAPTAKNANMSVVLVITDNTYNYSVEKTITVTPRAAKSIGVEKRSNFPTAINEGETVDLSSYINVTGYDSADQSDGFIQSYTLSADKGSFSGKTYSAGSIKNAGTVTVTVTATGSAGGGTVSYANKTASFTFAIEPADSSRIDVVKSDSFPASIKEGESADIADYITVTGYDAVGNSDGALTSYSLSASTGTFEGTVYTAPRDMDDSTVVTVTVASTGNLGDVSYTGKTATFSINASLDPTGWNENATGFDSNVWYQYTDTASGIKWVYKLNSVGDIIGLYTESANLSGIIDSGKCLNVPAKVNGRTVVGIGGDSAEHPFVPASQRGWTSISFPSSLTTINDFAFIGTTAPAKIVIPSNVKAIGVKAFYESNITQVVLSEFDGTIGSNSFAKTENLSTVTIKGGGLGLTLSSVAFADSALTDLSITGNVTVNKRAFKGNTSLRNVNLNGIIKLNEHAFSGCTGISNLVLSGVVEIGEYAFNGCTALRNVYLPVGTILHEYAFNGCSGIESLEANCNLPAHSFEGTGNINLMILDLSCTSIAYNWEGNSTNFDGTRTTTTDGNGYSSLTVPGRTIYVTNSALQFVFYGKDDTYLSPFGNSGTVQVFIPYSDGFIDPTDRSPINDQLALFGMTLETYDVYDNYKNAGGNTYVYVTSVNNINTMMENKGVTALADSSSEKKQTGINAYYSGSILTTRDIDKSKMTVTRIYGAEEGEAYSDTEFYVVRTSEFNTEQAKPEGVLEANIAAYEPVSATSEDLKEGQKVGTISATVIVFYTEGEGDEAVTKYYSAPVSIRVEEYTAKSYIEQTYGSYDAVAQAFIEYEERIKELEKSLSTADVDSIDVLTKELNECKLQYAALVEELARYVSENTTDETGYLGQTIDDTGNRRDVVFINGNAIDYTETDKTDESGNTVYTAEYDANGDGIAEEVHFVVKSDGIHLTDEDGLPVKADGTPATDDEGEVYSDKLGALQRQLTAQITNLKSQLTACDAGLTDIKEKIADAGYDFDTDLTGDNEYDKIANAINKLANRVNELEFDNDCLSDSLDEARGKVTSYASALSSIYNRLTGENLSEEDLDNMAATLTAMNGKIEKVQSDLSVAKATVADLRSKLEDAESEVSNLTNELQSTKSALNETEASLATAQADLDSARAEKDQLNEQYQRALAEGDEITARELRTQIDAKDEAINRLEATKADLESTRATLTQKEADLAEAQETVTSLQRQIEDKEHQIAVLEEQVESLSATSDGYKLTVATANAMFGIELADNATGEDISKAVNDYVKAKTEADATIEAIQKLLNTTATGNLLVSEISNAITTASNESPTDTANKTVDYTGYTKDDTVNKTSKSYTTGYSQGYSEGVKNSSNSSSTDSTVAYNNGYDAGYSAGKNSVNTTMYYNSGYNAGYNVGVASVDTSSTGVSYKKGYADGVASVDTSKDSDTYKSGYNAGYSAGAASVDQTESGAAYKNGYNAGYAEGITSVDTSSDGSTYKKGYADGVASVDTSNSSVTYKNGYNAGYNAGRASVSSVSTGNGGSTSIKTPSTSTTSNNMQSSSASADDNETEGSTGAASSASADNKTDEISATTEPAVQSVMVFWNGDSMDEVVNLGTTVVRRLPDKPESVSDMQACGSKVVNTISDQDPSENVLKLMKTNADSYQNVSADKLENAMKLVEYYKNHLEELSRLGSQDIYNVLVDNTKMVTLEVVSSVDIIPTDEQKTAIENGQGVQLTLSSSNFMEDGLYLIIHESNKRAGEFDLALTKAVKADDSSDPGISMSLSDLSPVTIVLVSTGDNDQTTLISADPADSDGSEIDIVNNEDGTPESVKTDEGKKGSKNIIVIILGIIAIAGLGFLYFWFTKKGGKKKDK